MLAEAFEMFRDLAVKAAGPKVIPTEGPEHLMLVANEHGDLRTVEVPVHPRNHSAGDVDTVASWAKLGSPAAVWYSRTGIIAVLDDTTRRDRVTLELEPHPQFETLRQLEAKPHYKQQAAFVRLLRIDLDGCQAACPNLLDAVRVIQWGHVAGGEGAVQHGKASLGKSIKSELSGATAIPEVVTLSVPTFAGSLAWMRQPVRCAIDIDAPGQGLQLLPLPGQLESALCGAEAELGKRLREGLGDDARVYYGQP